MFLDITFQSVAIFSGTFSPSISILKHSPLDYPDSQWMFYVSKRFTIIVIVSLDSLLIIFCGVGYILPTNKFGEVFILGVPNGHAT